MKLVVREIQGNWDQGYSLDKHIVSSTPVGYNNYGHMQFDTLRTEVGEAVFQVKYRSDYSHVQPLAQAIIDGVGHALTDISFVSPMPASRPRQRQPVYEVAREVACLLGVPYVDSFIQKVKSTGAMKDLGGRADREEALRGCFAVNEGALNNGSWSILLVDDLYDTWASLEAVCDVIRQSAKIRRIFVVALTRRH